MAPPYGPLAAFGASVSWAYATTRYTRAAREVGSTRVNFARVLVAFPTFALIALARGRSLSEGFDASRLGWLLLSVLSSYALADSVFFVAAARVGVTTALSIASVYPLWAALFGTIADGEPLGPLRLAGMALAICGVVWLVRERGDGADGPARRRVGVGLLLSALTSLLWAANSVAVKRASTDLDTLTVNAVRYGLALVLLGPQLRIARAKGLPSRPAHGWRPLLPAIVADAVVGSSCYVYGLSHTDLAVGATLSALAPVISAPVAIHAGEERWNARRFAAVMLTVAGVSVLVSARA
ncbi:MAG TPA: DMT family transporter [Polyangiaceae bacterium]|nr:DMT family transporter [Polyangiaceae bacterium]